MLAEAVTTVHTSGINWESVTAIAAAVTVVVGSIMGVVGKLVGNQITSAINRFRIDVIAKLDTRLTAVEQKLNDIETLQNTQNQVQNRRH